MDFGMAIIALKRGDAVARKGWNGKGMFLTLQNGSTVDGTMMRNEPAKTTMAIVKFISHHILI